MVTAHYFLVALQRLPQDMRTHLLPKQGKEERVALSLVGIKEDEDKFSEERSKARDGVAWGCA